MSRQEGLDSEEKHTLSTPEIHHVLPNPPPVPTTRGPPLTGSGRTPSGPPRGTPKRWSVRYSTGVSCRSEGDPLHASAVGTPEASATQRSGKYTVKGAAPLVPSAPDAASKTPESVELFWTIHTETPTPTTSVVFHIEKGASTIPDENSSIAFEVLESMAATHVSQAPLMVQEGQQQQQQQEEKREEQEEGKKEPRIELGVLEGAGQTSTGVSRDNTTTFSNYFNGIRDVANLDDDDEMDSLPAALPPPPPTPHPTANPATSSRFGNTATKLEFGSKQSTGMNGKSVAKGNGVRGGRVPETTKKPRTTTTTLKPAVFRYLGLTPPPPVLQPPIRSILNEVNAWMEIVSHVGNMGFQKRYLQDSDRAFRDMQRETEVLLAENAIAEKGLREAKGRYVNALDECDRLQKEILERDQMRNKRKNDSQAMGEEERKRREEEEEKYAEEIEAWRIEKGELLAQKALLLQRRNELQHHLRRGTNIKNVATVSRPQRTSQDRDDQIDGSIPPAEDLEIIQMRLEIKESRVCFEKLVEAHQVLKETRRVRQQEIDDECNTLRQTVTETKQIMETWRSTLQTSLYEAERLRTVYQKEGEDSLVLLLERSIEEARALLKPNDNMSVSGDSIRSRGASVTRRSSLNSTPRRGAGSFNSPPTPASRQIRLN
ncbi:uncharacterized protein TM35_000331510 [Trypanosoma theileri]|uniref:Uncharacterized protein n=1 Tax=Trypanosoma theileri TaxID=67003 RepID=A0A1X0NLT6_9TRYP|nr:uncharacterized protein TM35_000331510 [Trypanosoma theileri]ORC85694.1 hypothetical protein TM35_000331510 [Trypanosoma theileri]